MNRCCWILLSPFILVLLVLCSPLILLIALEILIFAFCGYKLPPLSCMVNKSPLTGKFDLSEIEEQPPIPPDLLSKTEELVFEEDAFIQVDPDKVSGMAEAVEITCKIMLATTTVATTKDMPEDMQGIFWMDGNAVPEEIVSLNYSVWDEGQNMFTKVNSYYAWTYLDTSIGSWIAKFQSNPVLTGMMAFAFDAPGIEQGRIWTCPTYDYSALNWVTSLGKFSMERLPGPGVSYKRGCYWFSKVFGECLEFGSYTLRKIMHTDGTPVQPAYDEYVEYMKEHYHGQTLLLPAPLDSPSAFSDSA